jgi:hypothetical protein
MMDTHQKYLEGGEIIYAPKVDSLVFHNGKGRVQLWFWLLESPNVRSVNIFWNNYADSLSVPVTPSTGLDSLMVYVPLTEERSYTLYVRTTDIFGNHSLSGRGSATSYGAIYESTLAVRNVKSAAAANSVTEIQWYGTADDYVCSEVRYTGVNDEERIVRAFPDETSTRCPDAKAGSTYEHRSLYMPANSIDTFYTAWQTISDIITSDDLLSNVKARWQFDDPSNITKARAGSPLIRHGEGFRPVKGPKAGDGAVRVAQGSYFEALHGMAANGGSRVNSYTVMFDFKVSETGRYYSFIQTTPGNNDDAEFFINRNGQIGIGGPGYSEYTVTPGEWHRLVISASMGNAFLYYIDGTLIHTGNVGSASVDSRWSWLPEGVLFFADEDGEDADIDISDIAVWDRALSDAEASSLGGVEEGEKPLLSVKAYWQFDDPSDITKASAGSPLIMHGDGFTVVEGPAAGKGAVRIAQRSYFEAPHGIAANGGGSRVNDYTVMFDFKVSEIGRYYSFFQTTLENNDDAEFFLRPAGNLGITGTGYTEYVVTAGEWRRLVISASMGNAYLYYLDGTLIHTGGNATVDSRWSWLPEGVLFFADEDGEDADMDVSGIAVWDRALSETEVAELGGVE